MTSATANSGSNRPRRRDRLGLADLRARGALRSLAARPLWLLFGLSLVGALVYGEYRLVTWAVTWVYDYPLIGSIAPAVIQRSLEVLFLTLMAAVMFSVLIASIGILYGSSDLELLLSQPVSSARVFTMKTAELFVNTAGLPLVLTLPVLIGLGHALEAHPLYYPVSIVAVASLYALPVTLGALLALVLVRFAPAGRVREWATGVSIGVAAAAVLGFRLIRPERLASITAMNAQEFEEALLAFTRLEIGWLPPAWATNGSWSALDGEWHSGSIVLLLAAAAGMVATGALARFAYSRGWVRNLDSAPAPRRRRRARARPAWERLLGNRLGVVGVVLAKDARIFFRDVQQWSQVLVLFALAGVYFVSLVAMPLPTQQIKDVLGAMNIAFICFILAGVALRVAYPGVSYEGGSYWLSQVSPLLGRHLVGARFLLVLPMMLGLGLTMGLAATFVLELSPILAVAAPVAGASSAFALTGLAVGIGAAYPKFDYGDVNELVMTPGAMAFMALALVHSALTVTLLARPAWVALRVPAGAGYWLSAEGLLILGLLGLLTLAATLLPLVLGAGQLARRE